MKIGSWLKQAKRQIDSLDADLIAVRVFAPTWSDRSWLVAHGEDEIRNIDAQQANRMVLKRAKGMPLAYVLESKEFYGREFWVRPGVLIPRPETENLVDLVKSLDLPRRANFLEIGTGSGCIAITLALEYPQSRVVASDLSEKALETAERNDLRHEGRVELVESNLLKDFEFERYPEHFDVLVANLPYVNKEWEWVNQENLSFEPASALYARGNNGLSIYQRMLKELRYLSGPDGLWLDYMVLEADPCQHEQLIQMAGKAGFLHLRTDGYGLLFEDEWRYWMEWEDGVVSRVHKPKEVLEMERELWQVSYFQEEWQNDPEWQEMAEKWKNDKNDKNNKNSENLAENGDFSL